MRPITTIAVHHTAGREGTQAWEAIVDYHVHQRGWRDVGYHYAIGQWGRAEFVLVAGRPVEQVGAHVRGHNETTIGVCFEGNFEDERPHYEQLVLGARCVADLCVEYGLTEEFVKGHKEFTGAATACPGRFFPLATFKGMVADLLRWRS